MKVSITIVALSFSFFMSELSLVTATTIRAVSLDEMLEQAEFIFEGKVIATEIRAGSQAATIKTCATFEILDILKGSNVVGPLELCFAGGLKGTLRRHIHRMRYPLLGEEGIYFVTSLDENHVHPLYGWDQGHLRIRQTGAQAEVQTANGDAIVAVESRSHPESQELSTGVARGMLTRRSATTSMPTLTPSAFKVKLRQLMKERP